MAAMLITATGLSRSFGAVRALRDVTLSIAPGQVHGLVGANGAGKSTFLNVLGGVVTPDAGTLEIDGVPTMVAGPRQAADLGFAFIRQELALIPDFSSIDNMTIGDRPRTTFGVGDRRRRRREAADVAERLGISHDLDAPVRDLSIAERGLVAIGRALIGRARFVSMDEPTASLSDTECERLFRIVRELAADGVAIAYVSHRLDEIDELCDAVTVFKDGRTVASYMRGGYSRDDLITGITGARTVEEAAPPQPTAAPDRGEIVLSVRGLVRAPRVHDVSFDLHRGEILGLAGVVGAGRTEVLRLLFGAERPQAGEMELDGRRFAPRHIAQAIEAGIALVPEERRSQALVMDDSIEANISLGDWKANRPVPGLPFISDRMARTRAAQMSSELGIKARNTLAAVQTLSGGNQQKVVFGRWLSRDCRVMLLDEPTRGVDIGARRQIWRTAEEFAENGGSVIVVCSELQELSVCHRVVVLVEGRDVGQVTGPGVEEGSMLEMIYSHTEKDVEQ